MAKLTRYPADCSFKGGGARGRAGNSPRRPEQGCGVEGRCKPRFSQADARDPVETRHAGVA